MSAAWILLALWLQSPPPASADAELLRLERVWNEAHLRGDAAALDDLWAVSFAATVPGMPVLSRDEALAVVHSGRMTFTRYMSSGVEVRVYGDAAIVRGRIERARERAGAVVTDRWLFTKAYVRARGTWRVVAFHASDAPARP